MAAEARALVPRRRLRRRVRRARSPPPTRALGDGTSAVAVRSSATAPRTREAGASPASRRPTCTCAAPTTSSRASATAGARSSPSARCSTAARRARSTTSGWPSPCSAWSSRTSPASCSPSTRPGAAATAWSSRRSSGSARPSCRGSVTPDHYVARPRRPAQAHAARDPAVRGRPRPGRRRPRGGAAGRARRVAQTLDEAQLARLAEVGVDLEERLGGPQDIEWALPAASSSCCSRAPSRPESDIQLTLRRGPAATPGVGLATAARRNTRSARPQIRIQPVHRGTTVHCELTTDGHGGVR